MRYSKTIKIFLLLNVFFLLSQSALVYAEDNSPQETISISLVYPQKTNAPKRELNRIEGPPVVTGDVSVKVVGIRPEQLRNPNLYVEYFLDDNLVYSTEDKKKIGQDRLKSLGFILNTRSSPDGLHTLVANLWDKDGPSAIGMRK